MIEENWLFFLLTYLASFGFIFLKVMQTLNSVFKQYVWIVPTSMLIAVVECYVIVNLAQHGYTLPIVLTVGFGSGTGALSASLLHRVLFKDTSV